MAALRYNFDFDVWKFIMMAIITVLLVCLLAECQTGINLKGRISGLESYNGKLKKRITGDSIFIFSQDLQLIMTDEALKEEKKKLELATINQQTRVETKTVYKTKIQLAEPIIIHDTVYVMRLPIFFDKREKWFSISGAINRLGTLQIDSLVTYNNFTHTIGDTLSNRFLGGLFAKRGKVVRLQFENPDVEVTGMRNIYVKPEPKWYELGVVKFGAGVIFGTLLGAAVK